MEILVFALVSGFKLYRPQEKFVPEPDPFQRFDVQMLKHVYNLRADSSSRSSDRRKSYVVQAAS
jgi:hypothetical protein